MVLVLWSTMENVRVCLVLCICAVLCGAGSANPEQELKDLRTAAIVPVELVEAVENKQAEAEGVESSRKVRQYFGPPPPPLILGPPLPPYYGGGFGGYSGGFGGFGAGYQRTRVVTRTRVRGGYYGGFGGGYYG